MRLPLSDPENPRAIDTEQFARMVDRYIEAGFRYFDTAATYHDGAAETALRKALTERYPREAYRLTDKLPTLLVENEAQQERIFHSQLAACGVEYFDNYLIHCATAPFCERAEALHSFDFARRMRDQGLTRRIGFSYHDTPELLERLLTDHPECDFVQLQISYADWEHTPIQARRCYETARRHGKPVVAMCPLKGGMLAALPAEAEQLLRAYRPAWHPAWWALRFAAGLEGVEYVLSGMSSPAQLEENIACLLRNEPLDEEELALLDRVAGVLCRTAPVQCTACGYCLPVCPQRIPVAAHLRLYNSAGSEAYSAAALQELYETRTAHGGRASDCIGCGRCERSCPQQLPIIEWLRRVAGRFEAERSATVPSAPQLRHAGVIP